LFVFGFLFVGFFYYEWGVWKLGFMWVVFKKGVCGVASVGVIVLIVFGVDVWFEGFG